MLKEIQRVAEAIGIDPNQLKLYGKWKAKIGLETVHAPAKETKGKLVLVSAMTPTPSGEGKTVTAIGLSMGLNRLGRNAITCLRQPSLGPVFGVKGGAAGGGKSVVEPMQEINLRLTGDIDAIGSAHNLLSAMLDNHIFHGNSLGVDTHSISWRRAIDMNERSLRHVVIGLGGKSDGVPREDGFLITAASEVMAILCIARDYSDLKKRLDQIVVGTTMSEKTVTAMDLKASGAMAALLKDAMEPNLVQTAEGTPALIHGGPFGNIALGTCSLTSTAFAINHSEYAVVEAGFATELGAEKFFDIVCRVGGFEVSSVVLVVSIRAIEYHGSVSNSSKIESNILKIRNGLDNLAKHIENIRLFGIEPVVAINKFETDTEEEIRIVKDYCSAQGVSLAVSSAFSEGGAGCVELAGRVIEACEKPHQNKYVYRFDETIREKIEKLVTQLYGGQGTEFERESLRNLARIETLGLGRLPVCMAKTQLSLSDDPTRLGRPRGFTSTVRKVEIAAGAGYVIADMGSIVAMPGLPAHPAAENIDLQESGNITGVF